MPSTQRVFDRVMLRAIDQHVGARLAYFRKLRGVGQVELGDTVGVTFQQIQKYERAANRISASKIYAFACVLDFPIAALFEGLDAENLALRPPVEDAADAAVLDALVSGDFKALSAYARLPTEVRAAVRGLLLSLTAFPPDEP